MPEAFSEPSALGDMGSSTDCKAEIVRDELARQLYTVDQTQVDILGCHLLGSSRSFVDAAWPTLGKCRGS